MSAPGAKPLVLSLSAQRHNMGLGDFSNAHRRILGVQRTALACKTKHYRFVIVFVRHDCEGLLKEVITKN